MIIHALQEGIRGQVKILLDGEDITGTAFLADDEAGFAICMITMPGNPACRMIGQDIGVPEVGPIYGRREGKVKILRGQDGR